MSALKTSVATPPVAESVCTIARLLEDIERLEAELPAAFEDLERVLAADEARLLNPSGSIPVSS